MPRPGLDPGSAAGKPQMTVPPQPRDLDPGNTSKRLSGSAPAPLQAPPPRSPHAPATDTHQLGGHQEPKDTPNPFASAMAAAHVAAGAGTSSLAQQPTAGFDLDLNALPSVPFSPSVMQQFLGSLAGGTSQPPGAFPPNMSQAQPQELKGLPSLGLGVGGLPGSADIEAMLTNLGGASNPGLGGLSDQMETSLTSLDLFSKQQLQMVSQQLQASGGGAGLQPTATTNWIPPLFYPGAGEHQHQQQGLAAAAPEDSWLGNALQSIQPVQGQGGEAGRGDGPGAMDGLASVASGLDNMQSIEQALPNLEGDVSHFITAAQQASMARTAQHQHQQR